MARNFKSTAWALSLAGILPFIMPVFWFWLSGNDAELKARAHIYMVTYGAIILSFLGGIRWGMALNGGHSNHLALSVIPSLLAWVCLLAPMTYQLPGLSICFVGQWAWDYRAARNDVFPDWFGHLRSFISLCVITLLLLAILSNFMS